MSELRDNWWRQPAREWGVEEWESIVIPGREESSLEGRDDAHAATDKEFTDQARKIKRRLSEESPPKGPNSGNLWLDGIREDIDRCAFYRSFRYGSCWGIYIGLDCWFNYSKYLFMNGIPADVAVDEAFYLLYRHEFFHFEVDKATEVLERVVGTSTGNKPDAWIRYHRMNNPSLLEEALANAHALEHAGKNHKKHLKRVRNVFEEVLTRQGPGYRDFGAVSGRGVKGDARSQLLSEIMGIHRSDKRFVPGLQSLISPKSYDKSAHHLPHVSYEGRKLNVYFY